MPNTRGSFQVTVPTPGTPVPLSATSFLVREISIAALSTNVGNVSLYGRQLNQPSGSTPVEFYVLPVPTAGVQQKPWRLLADTDLTEFSVGAVNANDGVSVSVLY